MRCGAASFVLIALGKVSMTLNVDWKQPFTESPADIEAAERSMQFKLGWFAHPVFVNGDYPEVRIYEPKLCLVYVCLLSLASYCYSIISV